MNITQGIATLGLLLLPACSFSDTAKTPALTAPSAEMISTKKASRGLYTYALARLRFLEGDAEGALLHLKDALAEDPKSPFLHKKVAEAYLKLNRPQEAVDACETAIRFDPDYRPAHVLLGMILAATGKNKEAIPHFEKAIQLNPEKEDAYVSLAVSDLKVY